MSPPPRAALHENCRYRARRFGAFLNRGVSLFPVPFSAARFFRNCRDTAAIQAPRSGRGEGAAPTANIFLIRKVFWVANCLGPLEVGPYGEVSMPP